MVQMQDYFVVFQIAKCYTVEYDKINIHAITTFYLCVYIRMVSEATSNFTCTICSELLSTHPIGQNRRAVRKKYGGHGDAFARRFARHKVPRARAGPASPRPTAIAS